MAGRRADVLDIREVIRRLQLGERDRQIARDLQVSRKTVSKYRAWAAAQGLLSGPLPDVATLQAAVAATLPIVRPPPMPSSVAPFRERIVDLRGRGVECRAIYQILRDEHGFAGAYGSVYRFVRRLEPRTPAAVVRVGTEPGAEAQVDFGYAGLMHDPRSGTPRKAWAFVMTLSFSRHSYVEFVFDQEVATWLRCHRRAFEWFGGVPQRVVVDNLKAAIVKAVLYDPVVPRACRECAEHYGFLISPCRPRTPEHKGKVEQGGVHSRARRRWWGGFSHFATDCRGPRATAGAPRPHQPAGLPPRRHPHPPLAHGVAHRLPGGRGADPLPPRLPPHRRPHPDPRQRPRAGRHAPDRPQDPRHLRPLQHHQ